MARSGGIWLHAIAGLYWGSSQGLCQSARTVVGVGPTLSPCTSGDHTTLLGRVVVASGRSLLPLTACGTHIGGRSGRLCNGGLLLHPIAAMFITPIGWGSGHRAPSY